MKNLWRIHNYGTQYECIFESPVSYFIANLSAYSTNIEEDESGEKMLTDGQIEIKIYTYNNRRGISIQGSESNNSGMNIFIPLSEAVVEDFELYLNIGNIIDHEFDSEQNNNNNNNPSNNVNEDPQLTSGGSRKKHRRKTHKVTKSRRKSKKY